MWLLIRPQRSLDDYASSLLDIEVVTADGTDIAPGAFIGEKGVNGDSLSKSILRPRVKRVLEDGMEDLEGVIGLPEVVGESEGMFLAVGL